jgi:two-component system cell cycle sensor histidine kinase PleC
VGARSLIDFTLMFALCGGVLLYFTVLANRLLRLALAGLSFQEEKDALIAELEQSKYNSDEARRRAESANLAKSRFLATMSHELRTPLNAILGFSEVMHAELFGPHSSPSYKEYSHDIHSSGQHLLMLINEILDLSRVEAGRYDLKEESVSLPGVVEECRHLLALRAKTKVIEVVEEIDADLPRIWADERALRQITLNILSNAIKFTPQGGRVTIKVAQDSARGQYLSIRDTGPGIPEEEITTVLSSFGRGSMAQKNAEEGTGLGLPIVRGLVELHGGEFKFKSKVREGTEVIVSLPPERVMSALASIDPEAPTDEELALKRALRAKRWGDRRPNAA